MYLLGYDIGSSSIKAALVDAETGATISVVQHPPTEMAIQAPKPGWAEQHPETWWDSVCAATHQLLAQTGIAAGDIRGVGISYQMHGLVVVDKNQQALRPSIIWCDSRAVEIGNRAFEAIGPEICLQHLLNSPGNFTASKLRWVQENEPDIYRRIDLFMLPGDYIAMRLTGEAMTTPGGLSEGICWDFLKDDVAGLVLDHYGIDRGLIPAIVPAVSLQGQLTQAAAQATGLRAGIPVAYRAGDQPNNALALNALQPGEAAATGGTSGVVYGVVDQPAYDLQSRVNGFAHVNHSKDRPRIGILLCINGCGIQYAWVRQRFAQNGIPYAEMEQQAAAIPVGSEGLRILPFGNGAERMLANRDPGAQINNLQFNRHTNAHFFRAALEGIAFSFVYGVQILSEMGVPVSVLRVGNDNLFQSAVFSTTLANLLGCSIQMVETTGAVGAAKAAGVATGIYPTLEAAVGNNKVLRTFNPQPGAGQYEAAYQAWAADLEKIEPGGPGQ